MKAVLPPPQLRYIADGMPTKEFYDFLRSLVDTIVPVGTIISTLAPTPPDGYLAFGTTYSKVAYPDLYAVLGTEVLPDIEDGLYLCAMPIVGRVTGSNITNIGHYHKSASVAAPIGTALGAGGVIDGLDVHPQNVDNRPRSFGVYYYIKAA